MNTLKGHRDIFAKIVGCVVSANEWQWKTWIRYSTRRAINLGVIDFFVFFPFWGAANEHWIHQWHDNNGLRKIAKSIKLCELSFSLWPKLGLVGIIFLLWNVSCKLKQKMLLELLPCHLSAAKKNTKTFEPLF